MSSELQRFYIDAVYQAVECSLGNSEDFELVHILLDPEMANTGKILVRVESERFGENTFGHATKYVGEVRYNFQREYATFRIKGRLRNEFCEKEVPEVHVRYDTDEDFTELLDTVAAVLTTAAAPLCED